MKMKRVLAILALGVWIPMSAHANESQRNAQPAPDLLGSVHFPSSCSPAVQKQFERGLALLHSFWYEEAEKSFEQVGKNDTSCAIAHWGVAMSFWHQLWDHPNSKTITRGADELKKAEALHAKTSRERDYIVALEAFFGGSLERQYADRASAYSKAMEDLQERYSDDREAAAFYALALLASESDDDTAFANRMKAATVLEKLFKEEPDHPGVAHYLIHAYDKPQLAKLGLPAALRYAKIAPAAPHALHMPSHIFVRLGMWQEDIDSNLASIAATRASTAMHMEGAEHQLHAMDFLENAYLQTGRDSAARKLIEELDTVHGISDERMGYTKIQFRERYLFEMHHWSEAASLQLPPRPKAGMEGLVYWARAIGSARSADTYGARRNLEHLKAIQKSMFANKDNEADALTSFIHTAEPWVLHAEGNNEAAVTMLRDMAEKEDKTGDQVDFPLREMLADLLMETGSPLQALVEYESDLRLNPNRFNGLYGAARAAELAGQLEKAHSYYSQVVQMCTGGDSNRPELLRAISFVVNKYK